MCRIPKVSVIAMICKSVFQGSCTTRLQCTDMRGPLVRLAEVAQISGYDYKGTLFEGFKAEDCENKSVNPNRLIENRE